MTLGAVVLVTLAGAALWLVLPATAQPAGAAGCVAPSWHVVDNPNVLQQENTFRAVAALASEDVWAAGSSGLRHQSRTLIQHWDGAKWTIIPSPNPSPTQNEIYALAARAADDVWAGGYSVQGTVWLNLLLHWDGRAWTAVPSPNPGSGLNQVLALTALARNDVWAVGTAGDVQTQPDMSQSPGQTQPMALHWDGSSWHVVAVPPAFPGPDPGNVLRFGTLDALALLAPGSLWAVGGTLDYSVPGSSPGSPLNDQWTGSQWQPAPTPPPPADNLLAVVAASPQDVWVGGGRQTCTVCEGTYLQHYDGRTWQASPSPEVGIVWSLLRLSATDLWAGARDGVLHGDGQRWVRGPQPLVDATDHGATEGWRVAGVGAHDVWAVAENRATHWTAVAHYGCAPSTPAVPGTASQSFPQTAQTASGLFLAYWQNHGGLTQQGYPIGGPVGEWSDLNGKPYTVQYFERAVLEYHPENADPFKVLLSQLGTFQFQRKYADSTPPQHANQTNGHYFTETGHWVGGRFWQYWQQHGGLAQQGYPLSDEFTEVSDLNGKPYTVQYFERAVFEAHPENAPPYDVLLSQLGTVRSREKYGTP
ncbi:MAG: hypothetical protein M3010_07660 [Candidatus Dormibacteraeota bacterium]|nr:hypothetical protein [Candidatus Dormibacteraeota bacterium]